MNKEIWKYPITHPEKIVIEMPKGAEVLTIQCQNNVPTIWAEVYPHIAKENRHFELFGTGHKYEGGVKRKYINTFQMDNGLVFHLFERID